MQIKTREAGFPLEELLSVFYWNMRSLGVAVLVLFFLGLAFDMPALSYFPLILAVLLIIGTRRSLCNKANRIFFAKRRYEMDDAFLNTFMDDGSLGKLAWGNFHRCVRFRKSTLLFLSETQFTYLPDYTFTCDPDLETFKAFLKDRGLLTEKKRELSGPARFLFEALFLLTWLVCSFGAFVFYVGFLSDAVNTYFLAFILFSYPVLQIARLVLFLARRGKVPERELRG